MNFAFGVVCKVTKSFAKSKSSPTSGDFAFRLGKPKMWTPPPNFFSPIAPARFFLRAILMYIVRASRRPGQVATSCRPAQAAFVVRRRRRSRQFGSVHLCPPPREGPRKGRSTSVPTPWPRTSSFVDARESPWSRRHQFGASS